ncbi:class I SAM-dependent methyltransferase [Streptomyces catenulae]|uniref:Methyltransferase domain-containing protein n=1 Tax=Streptomyces catenulae TaxID=66875 RepID=A0ABV2Z109_9ACTN|nr:class I SAM-dependent methyltransferase [Streptomyces catenulae]
MTGRGRALAFEGDAVRYAVSRPSYPAELFDFVGECLGRPWAGVRVADVGAGTGIATALLRERGAAVVAVEPGAAMAAELRRALPQVPLVRGDGNALPLADGSCDLVTYAQSWQWTDTARAVPEARRVVRAGGALAVWWNTTAFDVPWLRAQHERIARHCGVAPRAATRPDDATAIRLAGLTELRVVRRLLPWGRAVPLGTHLANVGSRSALLVLAPAARRAFLDAERERLAAEFPGGVVEERYVVDVLVAGER